MTCIADYNFFSILNLLNDVPVAWFEAYVSNTNKYLQDEDMLNKEL